MNAIWIVLPILTLLMFELGLTLQTEDFKLFRKRPRPIIAGLAGQIILLPTLAFALGHVFQLEPCFYRHHAHSLLAVAVHQHLLHDS